MPEDEQLSKPEPSQEAKNFYLEVTKVQQTEETRRTIVRCMAGVLAVGLICAAWVSVSTPPWQVIVTTLIDILTPIIIGKITITTYKKRQRTSDERIKILEERNKVLQGEINDK